jgi:hypothetical protein
MTGWAKTTHAFSKNSVLATGLSSLSAFDLFDVVKERSSRPASGGIQYAATCRSKN